MANNPRAFWGKMDREARAKQFMPFDALQGFQEALREKERPCVPKRELAEDWLEELDQRMRQIHVMDAVVAEYFRNGEYKKVAGTVSKIDAEHRILKVGGVGIPFEEIADLKKEAPDA